MNPKFQGPGQGGQFDPNQQFAPGTGGGGDRILHHAVGAGFYIERVAVLVLVLLVLALLFFLLYRVLKKSGGWSGHSPAIRELEMRYARGEIGRDDYLLRRSDLVAPVLPVATATTAPAAGGAAPPPQPPSRGATAAS